MNKKVLAIIMAGCLATVLTGCEFGKETAKSLSGDLYKNVNELKSVSMDFSADMAGSFAFDLEGDVAASEGADYPASMEFAMEFAGSTDSILKPEMKAKTDLDAKATIFGMTIPIEAEQYTVKEDGKFVSYSLNDGVWTKTVLDEESLGSQNLNLDANLFKDIESGKVKASLEDKTAEVNGKECYVLNVELDADYLKESLGSLLEDAEVTDMDDMNMDEFSTTAKYYIDKAEKLPVKVTMDMAEDLTKAMEDSEQEANITECKVEYVVTGHDNVKDFKLPEEAKNAVKMSE